jgi:Na+-driven multidrug efflux pump
MSFGLLTILGLASFAFAPHLIAFFVPGDTAVIASGARFLRIMALSWGFVGLTFAMTGVLRASGNMVMTMIITLVSQWVLQFPLAYVLSKHTALGELGIWIAFPVTNVITALITVAVYAKGDWKKKRLTQSEEESNAVTAEILTQEGH